jgi:hypothetical protein
MPQVITQTVSVNDVVSETLTFGTATGVQVQASSQPSFSYGNGTTVGLIDYHYEHTYNLTAAGTVTLTLSALTDDIGRTVAFARVTRLSIQVTSKTGNDYLTVGAAGTNPFISILGGTTPTYIVRNYDLKIANDTTGFVSTASSSDQLKIVNSGAASMTFVVSIAGRSV